MPADLDDVIEKLQLATEATTSLTQEVIVRKQVLDAAVDDAASSAGVAGTAAETAQSVGTAVEAARVVVVAARDVATGARDETKSARDETKVARDQTTAAAGTTLALRDQTQGLKDAARVIKDQTVAAASNPALAVQKDPATPTVPPVGVASGSQYWAAISGGLQLYLNTGGTGAPVVPAVIQYGKGYIDGRFATATSPDMPLLVQGTDGRVPLIVTDWGLVRAPGGFNGDDIRDGDTPIARFSQIYSPDVVSAASDKDGRAYSVVYEWGEAANFVEAPVEAAATVSATPKWPTAMYPQNIVNDAMWSWWVGPKGVEVGPKQYFTSITSSNNLSDGPSKVTIGQRRRFSNWERVEIGDINPLYVSDSVSPDARTDDHDVSNICVDPRPAATSPLLVHHIHHGSGPIRQWNSATDDAKDFGASSEVTITPIMNYSQTWRRPDAPDHVYHFLRTARNTSGRWTVRRSMDSGNAFTEFAHLIFYAYAYMLARPCKDGTGFHLVCYINPESNEPSKVAYLKLTWTGELSAPGKGVIVPNIWATDGSVVGIDPFTQGALIFTPTNELRLMDFKEFTTGTIDLCWSEFIRGGAGSLSYCKYDTATGLLTRKAGVRDAGIGIDAGGDYIAGAEIVAEYRIAGSRWTGAVGDIAIMSGSDLTATPWVEKIVDTGPTKIFRPVVFDRVTWDAVNSKIVYGYSNTLMYLKGDLGSVNAGYSDFYFFAAAAKFINDVRTV
jgi:hypothetical protein